jgi:fatty acid desaturase
LSPDAASSPRPRAKARLGLFRYSGWDAVPAFLAIAHLVLLIVLVLSWSQMNWLARALGACFYAFAIGWSSDSVAHNFIHNPFFVWRPLNRLMAYVLTLTNGAPQTMYGYIHMRHHAGNSDRIGTTGGTVDPISLYRYGAEGKVEPMASYVFKQFWRDDGPFTLARKIAAKRPVQAKEALHEFWVMIAAYAAAAAFDWRAVLCLAPFYYLGQCLSFLIAWYEHAGADPDQPIASGVSTYHYLYNWMFLNNGHHAEHHHRPKIHWTAMKAARTQTAAAQAAAGVRVIRPPHFLGFLDPSSAHIPTASAPSRAEPHRECDRASA